MTGMIATLLVQSLFVVEAKVFDSIEGGPLIFELSAKYTGRGQLSVSTDFSSDPTYPFDVELPKSWAMARHQHLILVSGDSFGVRSRQMQTGEMVVRRIALHKQYAGDIPAGPARINVVYNLTVFLSGGDNWATKIRIVKSVPIEIAPFTQQFAESVRKDLLRVAATRPNARSSQSDYETALSHQADRILGTSHPEFVPLALDFLRAPRSQSTRYSMRAFLWRSAAGANLLYQHDLATLRTGVTDRHVINEIFSDWRQRERTIFENHDAIKSLLSRAFLDPPQFASDGRRILTDDLDRLVLLLKQPGQKLPDSHLRMLCELKPLWLRAYVYVTFAGRLEKAWCDQFLGDLQARVQAVPEKQAQQWIDELGSDSFLVREAATEKLLSHFDRVQTHLAPATRSAAPEISRRVGDILRKGTAAGREPNEAAFLEWLRQWPSAPNCDRVLKVLVSGDPNCSLVKEAKLIKVR